MSEAFGHPSAVRQDASLSLFENPARGAVSEVRAGAFRMRTVFFLFSRVPSRRRGDERGALRGLVVEGASGQVLLPARAVPGRRTPAALLSQRPANGHDRVSPSRAKNRWNSVC